MIYYLTFNATQSNKYLQSFTNEALFTHSSKTISTFAFSSFLNAIIKTDINYF